MTDKFIGIVAMIAGSVLLLLALGELLLRIGVAFVALWLINYGLQKQGKGSLYAVAYNWYSFRKF